MGLFLNRKSSGMVLAGVVLSSSVMSAASQGVVSAVPQRDALNSFAGEGVKNLDSSFANFFKNNWKEFLVAGVVVVAIFLVSLAVYYNNRNEVINGQFKEVFCLDEGQEGFDGVNFKKKMDPFLGCVFKISVKELLAIAHPRAVENIMALGLKESDMVDIVLEDLNEVGGFLRFYFADEEIQGKLPYFLVTKQADMGKIDDNFLKHLNKIKESYEKDKSFAKVFKLEEFVGGFNKKSEEWEELRDTLTYNFFRVNREDLLSFVSRGDLKRLKEVLGKLGKNNEIRIMVVDVLKHGNIEFKIVGDKDWIRFSSKYTNGNKNDIESLTKKCKEHTEAERSGMTFGKVFINAWYRDYDYENGGWEKLKKFLEGKTFELSRKEIEMICDVNDIEDLCNALKDVKYDEKVKIRFSPCYGGRMLFNVLSCGKEKKFYTSYAATNYENIDGLIAELEKVCLNPKDKQAKEGDKVKKNLNDNVVEAQ